MPSFSETLAASQVIREPVGFANGYWAGAPGAYFSPAEKAWYLTYRIRRPRGIEPDRGGEARIARSTDLRKWDDVWAVTKDKYSSASIERSVLRQGADGQWRYFTSYVDPRDSRWCVSMLTAPSASKFNPAEAKSIFKAAPLGLEGVKDPWIMEHQGLFYMFLSVAVPTPATSEKSHSTLDIFNTGECVSASAIATSQNLDDWQWQGIVLAPPANGWNRYCTRINSVMPWKGKFVAFYDGSASHAENYEERCALAVSADLRQWKSVPDSASWLRSPHGTGSLRYLDVQVKDGEAYVFHECARADGAHDLRLTRMPVETLAAQFPGGI